jgi:nitrous oxidase accessory protein NosD
VTGQQKATKGERVRRIFGILFALVLMACLGPVTSTPALAATTIHVPADYPTIQAAIDAASDGDTIIVAAGLYKENVDIDKSLTLEGAQAGVDARTRTGAETIIEPDEGTGIRIITAADQVVVIDGLTVRNAEHGIATPEPTMAQDITVRNVRVLNPSDFGISPTFTLTTTVEYCYVEGAIQAINAGALVPFPATVATFRNNEIVNSQFGFTGYLKDSLIEGNVVRDFATEGTGISGQFLNTQIKNNVVSGYAQGAGMGFESHYGRDLSENVSIEGNTFTGNDLGIYVFPTQTTLTGITFNYNNIAGNSRYGLWNQGGETVDATKNWWGDVSGPDGVGPGDGDRISTKVLYSPWLGAELDTEPMTWGVDPTSSIQGAIDTAGPGDTIIASDGAYEENLNIDKSLTLRSAGGVEATTIAGSITAQLDGEIVSLGGEDTGLTIDAHDGDFAISLSIDNGSQVTISQSIITGAQEGITSRSGVLDSSTLIVDDNQILGNDYGIYLESIGAGSTVLINSNRITGNDSYGVYVKDSAIIVDATSNWWGDVNGPSGGVQDPVTSRIAGGAGDAVSEHIRFDPWLTSYQYSLTISSTGGGSVVVPGEGIFSYDPGTVVNLIAVTSRFYNFNGWTGDVGTILDVNSAATNITIKDDYSIVANFGFGPFGWCFIATAAYGSETAKQIDILREFRDIVLVRSSLGIKLVSLYYETSPPIAAFIARHEALRTVVRVGFLDPIVRILNWSHNLWSSGVS